MSKARQQRANVKARKAKARAEHEAKFGTWTNRKKSPAHPPRRIAPVLAPGLAMAAMETLFESWERREYPFALRIGGRRI